MANVLSLIPRPAEMRMTGRSFRLSGRISLSIHSSAPEITGVVELLRDELQRNCRVTLDRTAKGTTPGITITLAHEASLALDGSYSLSVNENGVLIVADTTAALFYAVQTFLQLLPTDREDSCDVVLPGVEITDRPRFSWRGMHLDVSRHFFPVEFIKKYIDLLARHKMNVFHWHLTDDQGWRVEIKKYPRLTEIGAWRKEADGLSYGGYYTQAEIRKVVDYARQRFVTIVPEIEMPGHATAALAAYPEFSCTGGPFKVVSEWGVFDDVYCPGNDATFTFLQNVLGEIADLFPGQYVHVGGDECPKARWQHHDRCQQLMQHANLKNEDALQAWFIARIAKYLHTLGKRIVGWDEILDGGAPEDTIIMAWRNAENGIEAARAGHEVVMTPMTHCYFDHYQGNKDEPKAIGGFTPLSTVYSFEPVPEELPDDLARFVIGAQGNVWTEYMPNTGHIEYMVFPRLCALAEVLWSPKDSRSWPDFLDRLSPHLVRLDRLGVNYRRLSE